MKQFLNILMLVISFTAFSQTNPFEPNTPKPIKYEHGRFYIDGNQIPSYQMKTILASNLHSIKLYKQAKSKETLGGMLLGLGTTACIVDLAVGLFSDVKYPTAITYVGLGVVAASIPILSGRRKKTTEAIQSYNDGLKNTSSLETDFNLNALANQNGIGIQIKF